MLRRASAIENSYLSSLVAAPRVANALATIVVTSVQGELPARRQHRRGICRWLLLVCDDYCSACFIFTRFVGRELLPACVINVMLAADSRAPACCRYATQAAVSSVARTRFAAASCPAWRGWLRLRDGPDREDVAFGMQCSIMIALSSCLRVSLTLPLALTRF